MLLGPGLVLGARVGKTSPALMESSPALGRSLGRSEGTSPGTKVGTRVGRSLGARDGKDDSTAVGDELAAVLGDLLGFVLGAALGENDGPSVGDNVNDSLYISLSLSWTAAACDISSVSLSGLLFKIRDAVLSSSRISCMLLFADPTRFLNRPDVSLLIATSKVNKKSTIDSFISMRSASEQTKYVYGFAATVFFPPCCGEREKQQRCELLICRQIGCSF